MGNNCCQLSNNTESVDLSNKNEDALRHSEKGFDNPIHLEDLRKERSRVSKEKHKTGGILLNEDDDFHLDLLNRRLVGMSLRKIDTKHIDKELIEKFKPTQEANKKLLGHIVKVYVFVSKTTKPDEIYKIHIIPSNNHLSDKLSVFSKKKYSLEESDLKKDPEDWEPAPKPSGPLAPLLPESEEGVFNPKTLKNMNTYMAINKASKKFKTIIRRQKKLQSNINVRKAMLIISLVMESFISEKHGKFSDVYKVLAAIGEGGYGKVFKVQHRGSLLIRAMKSTHF
jgi:hypothetical protein